MLNSIKYQYNNNINTHHLIWFITYFYTFSCFEFPFLCGTRVRMSHFTSSFCSNAKIKKTINQHQTSSPTSIECTTQVSFYNFFFKLNSTIFSFSITSSPMMIHLDIFLRQVKNYIFHLPKTRPRSFLLIALSINGTSVNDPNYLPNLGLGL